MESYREDRIEVRTYFRDGGKVIGTEVCSSESEARTFAKHQLAYFPHVEVVLVHGMVEVWGFKEKSSEILCVYDISRK